MASNCGSSSLMKVPQRRPSMRGDSSEEEEEVAAVELETETSYNKQQVEPGCQEPLEGSSSSLTFPFQVSKASEQRNYGGSDAKDAKAVCDETTSQTAEEDDPSDHDDQDDDATCVTSNQNKSAPFDGSIQFPPSSSVGINSINKIERWSAGDKPSLSNSFTSSSKKSNKSRRSKPPMDKTILHSPVDDLKCKLGIIAFPQCFIEEGSRPDTPSTASSSTSQYSLTEERVRSFLTDFYTAFQAIYCRNDAPKEDWDDFLDLYFTSEAMWIRASGNPLDRKRFQTLMMEEIEGQRMTLVSIDSVQLLARRRAAVVVSTVDKCFLYKGEPKSERSVSTIVLHVVNAHNYDDGSDGIILIGHEHRCQGKPIPKETRWR